MLKYDTIYMIRKGVTMSENLTNEIIDILNEIDDTVDYKSEKHLIDDHILDSFGIISLVAALEGQYDVTVSAAEMVPENFNSADAIAAMVERLRK